MICLNEIKFVWLKKISLNKINICLNQINFSSKQKN